MKENLKNFHVSNVLCTIQQFKIVQESVHKQIKKLNNEEPVTFGLKTPKNNNIKKNKRTKILKQL